MNRPENAVKRMIVPFLLLLISGAAAGFAILVPEATDLLLLAGPAVLGSLYLLLRAYLRPATGKDAPDWIILDGSNVMHWKDGTPQIKPVKDVLRHLTKRGFTPGVVFDANAGYLIAGRYQHDGALGRQLGLAKNRVMVVPKGTPADPYILTAARDLGARIVTNDRYRDWATDHPEVTRSGHLVRGEYRSGKIWLDLDKGQS